MPTAPSLKLVVTALLLAAACAAWPVMTLDSAQAALFRSQDDLTECRRLISKIETLRGGPRQINTQASAPLRIAELIDQAAAAADMEQSHIERVWPSPAHRFEKSAYKVLSTRVMLQAVTMHQALTFLDTLRRQTTELSVTDVRFSASRQATDQERWRVEAVLSSLLYSPAAVR